VAEEIPAEEEVPAEGAPGVSLETMAGKGARKYRRKVPTMERAYTKAKDRAIKNYTALPFGPTRDKAYRSAWEYMPRNYKSVMKPGLSRKWRRNWIAKMRE